MQPFFIIPYHIGNRTLSFEDFSPVPQGSVKTVHSPVKEYLLWPTLHEFTHLWTRTLSLASITLVHLPAKDYLRPTLHEFIHL